MAIEVTLHPIRYTNFVGSGSTQPSTVIHENGASYSTLGGELEVYTGKDEAIAIYASGIWISAVVK